MDDTVKIRFEWPLDDKNPDVRILLKAVRECDARIRELEALVMLFAYCEDAGTRAKFREELNIPPRTHGR